MMAVIVNDQKTDEDYLLAGKVNSISSQRELPNQQL
jgi:hypothetical protein